MILGVRLRSVLIPWSLSNMGNRTGGRLAKKVTYLYVVFLEIQQSDGDKLDNPHNPLGMYNSC